MNPSKRKNGVDFESSLISSLPAQKQIKSSGT